MLRVATVFSGIGAFEHALKKESIQSKTVFACDNGERYLKDSAYELKEKFLQSSFIDINSFIVNEYSNLKKQNFVKKTYDMNHEVENWYEDIRFLDGTKYHDNIDIFVGGSPCQSFSIIGKRGGLDDTRGTLFYDYARLIKEIEPKVFLFENVVGLINHDKGKTWETIKKVFDDLGYHWHMQILNSIDFGIPQNRKRVFVIGFKEKKFHNLFEFPKGWELNNTMFDHLSNDVEDKYYLGRKGFEFVTNPKYKNRARVNRNIIQTQKANQQFNWNGDFYFESSKELLKRKGKLPPKAYESIFNGELGVIRKLVPMELLSLMGFDQDFKITNNDVQAYRQIGNSIVVTILQEIIKNIIHTKVFDK